MLVTQSHLTLHDPMDYIACQAPVSMEFSRQEYWSRYPFPYPGDLPDPQIEPGSSTLQVDSLLSQPPVVVQSLSCVQFFVTSWTAAHLASLPFSISRSLLKLISIELMMPSSHIILCHPLFLPPSIFSSISCCLVVQCLTLCDPVDWRPIGSSVHGILQARILEWVAISFSRGSSGPRDWTRVSYVSWIGRQIIYHWATWEALHEGLFHWVGSSHQVAKVLELQLQHQSFQCTFKVDFL